MSFFDTILLIVLGFFVFYGFFYGLIKTFGSLAGVVLGALLASQTYMTVFDLVQPVFLSYNNIGKFVVFLILFTLVDRLTGLLFSILDKAFDIISILPFLKTINRLTGAILGFIMGIVVLGLILYIGSNFFGTWFNQLTSHSLLMPFLTKSASVIVFFLPFIFTKIKEFMRNWGASWGWGI